MKSSRSIFVVSIAIFSSIANFSVLNAQDLSNNSEVQQAEQELFSIDINIGIGGFNQSELESMLTRGIKALETLEKYNSTSVERYVLTLCNVAQNANSQEYIVEFCDKPKIAESESKTAALPSSSEIDAEYQRISKIPKITTEDINFSVKSLTERCNLSSQSDLINNLQNREKSIEYCEQSHNFSLKLLNDSSEAQTYLQSYLNSAKNLAKAHDLNQNYQQAIEYLEKTLDYAEGIEYQSYHYIEQRLAELHMLIGDYDKAIDFYQKAKKLIALKNKQDRERGFETISDDAILAEEIGLAYLYNGELAKAEKEFNNLKLYDQDVTDEVRKDYYGAFYHDNDFTLLERLKVEQGKIDKALEVAESKRGRLLSQAISNERDSLSIGQIKDIAKKQNSTLVLYSLIADKFQPIVQQNNDYYKPLKYLYIWVVNPSGKVDFRQINFPSPERVSYKYNQIDFANISFISLFVLGIVLGFIPFRKNKLLVCLGILIACFGIASCTNQSHIGSTIEFDSLIDNASNNNLNSTLPLQSLTQDAFAFVKTNSRSADSSSALNKSCGQEEDCLKQLYKLTIEPIADLLPSDEGEQVIFIPDAELFKVPFPALIDSKGEYLIEKYAIRTAPSIKLFHLIEYLNKNNKVNPSVNESLVVGNPIMPTVITNRFEDEIEISQLPGTEDEAQEIARILNTEPLIGEEATEIEVFKRIPQSKTIHIATHGFIDATIPSTDAGLKSLLTLTPSETDVEQMRHQFQESQLDYYPYDGLLSDDDIYVLDLSNTDLVVLSACDTGRGKITADGVHSIARPFIVKGANSVVVSLWQIDDDPSAELMVEFYENLQSGKNKAQALRQAMLKTKEKYPEPYNWAAFTLVGEAI